jgi:hypothetical protein
MPIKNLFISSIVVGLLLVAVGAIWLSTAQPVNAQCGSQASSCKNCHEVQGQDPVNSDGTAWHQSHAFGDFCYICHAGNNHATDKDTAHMGMVAPLSDVKAACQQCHPNDLVDRANKYAVALGTSIDNGDGASEGASISLQGQAVDSNPPASDLEAPAAGSNIVPVSNEIEVNNPNTVDYVLRYEEIALGKHPTNWGNVILLVLIAAVVLGGGSYVLYNEGWVKITFTETRPLGQEYPADIVEMLPQIALLKPATRQSLSRILVKQPAVDDLFASLDKLTREKHV